MSNRSPGPRFHWPKRAAPVLPQVEGLYLVYFLCWVLRNPYSPMYTRLYRYSVCMRRVGKKRRHEQDLYRTFLFRHTHVTLDSYKNEVQHNTGHMSLYMVVQTVDLHCNFRTGKKRSPPLLCLTRPKNLQGSAG
jgi:hypothetical protein